MAKGNNITVVAGKTSILIADTSGECTAFGVKVQSLDANGSVFISQQQGVLDGTGKTGQGNPGVGLFIKQLASPTNVPSVLTFAPFKGQLFARNFGAASPANDSDIAVEIYPLE